MASMQDKDYYAILEVSEHASDEEIRHAFQKKARKLHPDVNKAPDAEEKFKEVSEAYAVLSDAEKRRRYDALRHGAFIPPSTSSAQSMQDIFDFGFGGFAGSPFTASRIPAYNPRPGHDVQVTVSIGAKEAAQGAKKGITYERFVTCDVCGGSGSTTQAAPKTCPMCAGLGSIDLDLSGLFGTGVMKMPCPECEGSGKVIADPCSRCQGTGRYHGASERVVEVAPHAHEGDEIRIKGQGNAGTNGAKSGDLLVNIEVPEEHLSPEAAFGFQTIGFGLPFLGLGWLFGLEEFGLIVGAIALIIGFVILIKQGLFSHGLYWVRTGAKSCVHGITNGLFLFLLCALMTSCTMQEASMRNGLWY